MIPVLGQASVDASLAAAPLVDALLLDSGKPALRIQRLGGTGHTHDWASSARIRALAPVPVWLAGGLSAANIAAATDTVQPHGVDLCSSVRAQGRLDAARLAALAAAVRRGPTPLSSG